MPKAEEGTRKEISAFDDAIDLLSIVQRRGVHWVVDQLATSLKILKNAGEISETLKDAQKSKAQELG